MTKRTENIPQDEETVVTSLRLSREGELLRIKLAKKLGVNKSAVIELAIRVLAANHGIDTEAKP